MAAESDSPTFTLLTQQQMPDADRVERLLPLVYEQLRSLAQRQLRGEAAGHTLQATALVHEAFLRLVGPRELPWQNRAHFFAAAAEAMRRILVEHARKKTAQKRGGPDARRAAVDLAGLPDPNSEQQSMGFLILDQAITRLQQADPEASEVVRLRYFAGLSIDETASALGVSAPTVKRLWTFARGWLKEAIDSERD
ncbi:MAG: ECF-type sigma factor [Planctomycetota bacterium]